MSAAPLLELDGVVKVYENGTVALDGVSISVNEGEVHALVGANGAGKSTVIKVVAGAEAPSGGTLRWAGEPVVNWSPGKARDSGVGTVHQSFPLVPELSALENVFIGQGTALRRWRRKAELGRYEELSARLGVSIPADSPAGRLPIGQRQLVAIMQVLSLGSRLVILDEPTASLAQSEREIVLSVVKRLSETGTSFLYVSHHLEEILSLCNSVTVLRDGRVVARHAIADVTKSSLIQKMTDDEMGNAASRGEAREFAAKPILLDAQGLATESGLRDIGFTLHRGEILGFFGAIGSGCSDVLKAIYGVIPATAGSLTLDGYPLGGDTATRLRQGCAFVSDDRRRGGLFLDWEIWRNTSICDLSRFANRFGVLANARERERGRRAIRDFNIRAPSVETKLSELSGGNQQKVVFAKWIEGDYRLFMFDQPTVAVDVQAKEQILGLVRGVAAKGCGVLMHSVEPEELLAVCDTIVVVQSGRMVAVRRAADTNEAELLSLATGGKDVRA